MTVPWGCDSAFAIDSAALIGSHVRVTTDTAIFTGRLTDATPTALHVQTHAAKPAAIIQRRAITGMDSRIGDQADETPQPASVARYRAEADQLRAEARTCPTHEDRMAKLGEAQIVATLSVGLAYEGR